MHYIIPKFNNIYSKILPQEFSQNIIKNELYSNLIDEININFDKIYSIDYPTKVYYILIYFFLINFALLFFNYFNTFFLFFSFTFLVMIKNDMMRKTKHDKLCQDFINKINMDNELSNKFQFEFFFHVSYVQSEIFFEEIQSYPVWEEKNLAILFHKIEK
ncbi:Hypothetical protein KVN_LOCUS96 [uncultured virus]|nr:Hypothetical protein KVN_LOCUS96 [uncultured virus]